MTGITPDCPKIWWKKPVYWGLISNPQLNRKGKAWWLCMQRKFDSFWTDVPTPPHSPSPNSVFLAWEGNDWLSSTDNDSVLEPKKADQGGYSLEVSLIQSQNPMNSPLNLNLLTINGLNHLISSLANLNQWPE